MAAAEDAEMAQVPTDQVAGVEEAPQVQNAPDSQAPADTNT